MLFLVRPFMGSTGGRSTSLVILSGALSVLAWLVRYRAFRPLCGIVNGLNLWLYSQFASKPGL
jgi:hypothetical protein